MEQTSAHQNPSVLINRPGDQPRLPAAAICTLVMSTGYDVTSTGRPGVYTRVSPLRMSDSVHQSGHWPACDVRLSAGLSLTQSLVPHRLSLQFNDTGVSSSEDSNLLTGVRDRGKIGRTDE
ncbi:hypothetical protein RRG08_047530 [Elysia crispata]|uniref:Uncharacterized protein n=1 Tax=Elysia crispata TaxID=231223 RepID=A0AAE0YPW3_9GAST|nr:hypothetical protein RRG08_047530 [Elysia crispata]